MLADKEDLFKSFPLEDENRKPESISGNDSLPGNPAPTNRFIEVWQGITQLGLAELFLRLATNLLLLLLVIGVIWAVPQFYVFYSLSQPGNLALAAEPTPTPIIIPPELLSSNNQQFFAGIPRLVQIHTSIPNRARLDVQKYVVKPGDTLFGIAESFGLKPETILWGNQFILADNPHNLRPEQELNILPTDGTYYKWQAGDGLNGVAKFFSVEPEDIINWPGNQLNPDAIGDYTHPNIEPGSWLVIPGGKRAYVTWSAPEIPRDNPGVAKVLGPGACANVADGAIGIGLFIWPTNAHFLSGFDYSPATNHFGIDIDGDNGNAVWAPDNGVIVYAGWNNWGYGNVIVINHGNGWQTLFSHLSSLNVTCGQSVYQGNMIGGIGSTGNSSGPHLHFEMMYNGTKVNPWDYLPK